MIEEPTALMIADVVQGIALATAVIFQIVMVVWVVSKRTSWQYTILTGGFFLHITIFYIVDAFRIAPIPNVFFLFWSSLLRLHGVVVVAIMTWVVIELRRQWIRQ